MSAEVVGEAETHSASTYIVAACAVLYVASVAWLAAPSFAVLHGLWVDSFTYSHGYLVVALAAWMVYCAWKKEPLAHFSPSIAAVPALALVVVVLLAGRASNTQVLAQMMLPLLLWTAFLAAAGWRNASRFFWPLAYLYFSFPIWDVLRDPLRDVTTGVVGVLVRASEIPAFIEGNTIQIPSGTFEIEGGCSGLHYLIVALALSGFYGLVYLGRWSARIALGLAALALALLANWLRVFTLVVVGHVTEMQHFLITVDHYYFGWVLFAVVMTPLLFLARRLERFAGAPPGSAGFSRPQVPWMGLRGAVAVGGAWAVVAAGIWLSHRIDAVGRLEAAAAPVVLPDVEGWVRTDGWDGASRPVYRGSDADAAGWYRRDGVAVGVYFADYPAQRQGREVVFFANRPQGEDGRISAAVKRTVPAGAHREMPVAELVIESNVGRRIVWYTLRVAGWSTANELAAKSYQAFGAVAGRRDAQVLVLTAECAPTCERARESLTSLMPQISAALLHE